MNPPTMPHRLTLAAFVGLTALALSAGAGSYSFTRTESPSVAVPDGNASGLASLLTVPALGGTIADVNLTLTLVGDAGAGGGWNGDLYVYLTHGGALSVLLNRPGISIDPPIGFAGNGLAAVLFDDEASTLGDVHVYQTTLTGLGSPLPYDLPLTGSWEPDGRFVDPALVTAGDPRSALLNVFDGGVPGGDWALFVADLSPGLNVRLESWRLDLITDDSAGPIVIPEPVHGSALAAALTAILGLGAWRLRRSTRHDISENPQQAFRR